MKILYVKTSLAAKYAVRTITAGKKGETLIGDVLTLKDSALSPKGCHMENRLENGLMGAGYLLKPSSFPYSTFL